MPKPIPTERKLCKFCGNKGRLVGKYSDGSPEYAPICQPCRSKPYRRLKQNKCVFCGFVPVHSCQLDVDHIDGNHENNEPTNLQTLCANCHRLKTIVNRDWEGN